MSPTEFSIDFHKLHSLSGTTGLAQAAALGMLAGSVHAMLQCSCVSRRHRAAVWRCCRACTLCTAPLPHQHRFRLPARVPHCAQHPSKIPGLEPDIIDDLCLRWAGHVARMDEARLPRHFLTSWVHAKRRCGHPYKSTIHRIQDTIRLTGAHLLPLAAKLPALFLHMV